MVQFDFATIVSIRMFSPLQMLVNCNSEISCMSTLFNLVLANTTFISCVCVFKVHPNHLNDYRLRVYLLCRQVQLESIKAPKGSFPWSQVSLHVDSSA